MNANQASIMPQVVARWCEQEGHDVNFICYTGPENLFEELPHDSDIVFIGAFTEAAILAYSISNVFRSRGAVTVLGGPHARCFPQDAVKYFDYVLGFTDRELIRDVLQDCTPNRPEGVSLSAGQQPAELPGVEERWKYIEQVHEKSRWIKGVSTIGSLGCPYTCNFCIDSVVPHQPLGLDLIKSDLKFLLGKFKKPNIGWHDPNFGVRFDECMGAIEDVAPPGSFNFFAESSLSILTEPHLKTMQKNGFKAVLPGIESWYGMGDKSRSGKLMGMEKVQKVSDHVNLVLSYIPYIQTNFVVGLDTDEGPDPFELTKLFVDLAPGAFPVVSVLQAFGQAAPLNLEYQSAGRVLPFPFHFLNNYHVMNVMPRNYEWPEFYDRLLDMQSYIFSWRAIRRRLVAARGARPVWLPLLNVIRARCSEGVGRIRHYTKLRELLDTDPQVQQFWAGETTEIPEFLTDWIKKDIGVFWDWLPEGALYHDPNAYLKTSSELRQVEDGVAASG